MVKWTEPQITGPKVNVLVSVMVGYKSTVCLCKAFGALLKDLKHLIFNN